MHTSRASLAAAAVTYIGVVMTVGAAEKPQRSDAAKTTATTATQFEMRSARLFSDDTADPKIIGGTKANPANWPATFVFQALDGGRCTSTVVGERVVIV